MKEETPKDISPIKRKGIDIAVKGLRRPFPFVVGYDDDSTDQYESSHYIDLIIDIHKLSEYMGVEINPYWEKFVQDNPQHYKIYSMWSYLKFDSDMLDDIANHPGYILTEEVKETLTTIYEYLPEEYKLYYKSNTSLLDPPPTYQVHLKVNGFLMT